MTRSTSSAHKVYCEVDNWYFDPRYTAGECPICGWKPNPDTTAPAPWVAGLERVPWDLVGLALLLVALIVAGVFVGLAAGINLAPK